MSRFLQANAKYQAQHTKPTSASSSSASPSSSAPKELTAAERTELEHRVKKLRSDLSIAKKDRKTFEGSLEPLGARCVRANNPTRDHVAGENGTYLTSVLRQKAQRICLIENKIHGARIKLGETAPPEPKVRVWVRDHWNPSRGRYEMMSKSDADKCAMWEALALADEAHAQLMAKKPAYRNEVREMERVAETQRQEEKREEEEAAKANYVIERRMVGLMASMHGVRCYHWVRNADGHLDNRECDCTKTAPGVFVVTREPGTYFLKDAVAKRQIALFEARGGDKAGPLCNPGGYGQPVTSTEHALQVHMAEKRQQQPGTALPGDDEASRMPLFATGAFVVCGGMTATVRDVGYELARGGWVYNIRYGVGGRFANVRQNELSP